MDEKILGPDNIRAKDNRKCLTTYTKPTLKMYGEVQNLTTGGSGNSVESSNGQTKRP